MFTLRQRIFIGVSVIVGIVLVGLLFYFLNKRSVDPELNTVVAEPVVSEQEDKGILFTEEYISSLPEEEPEERYLRQLATNFVERFESYSNQNKNQHIVEVLPMLTDQMVKWVNTQYKDQGATYAGVTTRVVVAKLSEKVDDTATIQIETQRQIVNADGTTEVQYKKGRITTKKIDGVWKVDGFFWYA